MMISKNFRKHLPIQTQIWIEKNIITTSQADKILSLYEDKSEKNPYLLFAIIGSIFIGIGIISIIAHNWDELGKPIRFAIGIFPLLMAQVLGFYTLKYRYKNRIWHESVGIFWFLTIGAAIAIIGQTYHLGSSLRDFYLTWVLLAFPLLFLLKSDGVAFLLLGIINLRFFEAHFLSSDKFIFLATLCLWLIYYIYKIIYFKNSNPTALLSWTLVFTLCVNLISILHNFSLLTVFYSYLFLLLGFYYADFAFFGDLSLPKRAFKIAAKFGLGGIGVAFLVGESITDLSIKTLDNTIFFDILCGVSFIVFVLLFNKRKIDDILYPLMPSLACILLHEVGFLWIYNIAFVGILGFMIYESSIKGKLLSANFSLVILCSGIFLKFAVNDFGFIVQGLTFIALGVCFLYINLYIKKRIKK